jgi:ABC-2 type transport system ATP-binding protein
MSILSIQSLVVHRGDHKAVDGLSLGVDVGSIYALLGGNGAGKTTTLNVLLGFLPVTAGSVTIAGESIIAGAPPHPALAYLPEQVAMYPYLSAIENVGYFCALAGLRPSHARIEQLLSDCGLDAAAHRRRVSTYSKGMRQKVGLAIAYAKNAQVLLLDEPTSGLDPSAANDFADRIRQARQAGSAVLMATHDLFNAKQMADRIGIMRAGRLVHEFDASTVDHDTLERTYLDIARDMTSTTLPVREGHRA